VTLIDSGKGGGVKVEEISTFFKLKKRNKGIIRVQKTFILINVNLKRLLYKKQSKLRTPELE